MKKLQSENLVLVSHTNFNRYTTWTHTLTEILKLEGHSVENQIVSTKDGRHISLDKVVIGRLDNNN